MRKHSYFLAAMLLCGMLPFSGCSAKAEHGKLSLYCLNIGKADCLILQFDDKTYLIDTGYEHTFPALETALNSLDIQHLDGVFITHCHQDHVGGLSKLVQTDIAIDHIYAAAKYYDVKEKKHPVRLAATECNMEVEWLNSGDIITIENGCSFNILGPVQVNENNENNNSLVMHFTSPHGSILFTGDMKDEEENEMIYHKLLKHCDVLKCAHHGDNGATSEAFLRMITPRCAVISTHSGEEEDTPSPKTIARLRNFACSVYVTQDAQDAYCIELENGNITVRDIAWPGITAKVQGIKMEMNAKEDTVTLKNTASNSVSLENTVLYSSKGNETYSLPSVTLAPDEVFTIGSSDTKKKADYSLPGEDVWHNKKLDTAILYDTHGRILATCNNGKEE